jgi:2-polyprenyl-3-methyl-5-hydroxy-6-metoxy-1,4-benzoquinol methylase
MKCRVCSNTTKELFKLEILHKHSVTYFKCENCSLIQTEKPYWLNEAYSSAIASADTGLLQRNIILSRKVASIIYFMFNKEASFMDFAGGYGVFTRLMRDMGFDYYWDDIYAENLFAKGFSNLKKNYEMVTAFEVFEHIQKPIDETKNIFKKYNPTAIVFSTLLYKEPIDKDWWYFTPATGQHVSIYNKLTLEYIAREIGVFFYTDGKNTHIFSKKKLNFFQQLLLTNVSILLSFYVQLRMKSLTFSDHLQIVKKNK